MSYTGVEAGIKDVVAVGRLVGNTYTYTTLVGVGDIPLPEGTSDKIEVTSQSSPGNSKEYILGRTEYGDVSFEMDWVPGSATDTVLLAVHASREDINLRYTIYDVQANTSEVYIFAGNLMTYGRTSPNGDKRTATATFTINNEIV